MQRDGAAQETVEGRQQDFYKGGAENQRHRARRLIERSIRYFFGGNAGVGGLIFTSGLTLRTSQAYVGALVFAGAAIAMTGLLQIAERRLDRWRTSP